MAKQHIYTVRTMQPLQATAVADPNPMWRVFKMDRQFEVIEAYEVTEVNYVVNGEKRQFLTCSCFAGNKTTCRHRTMIGIFQLENAIDTGKAYDFDKSKWFDAPKPSAFMGLL